MHRTMKRRAAAVAAVVALASLAGCDRRPAGLDATAPPSLAAGGKVDQGSQARYTTAVPPRVPKGASSTRSSCEYHLGT